jgi:TonB family protein
MNDTKRSLGATGCSAALHVGIFVLAALATPAAFLPEVRKPKPNSVVTLVHIPLVVDRSASNSVPIPTTVIRTDLTPERQMEEPSHAKIVVGGLDSASGTSTLPPESSSQDKVVVGGLDSNVETREPAFAAGSVRTTGMFAPVGSVAKLANQSDSQALDGPIRLMSAPEPLYSEEARRLNVTGEVVLEVEVAASGKVQILRVLKCLGHGLDQAAIEAVTHVQFQPARKAGHPVDAIADITVVFKLA